MAKVRVFRGARSNIVQPSTVEGPAKLAPRGPELDETELEADSPELEALSVAGAPPEVVKELELELDLTEVEIPDEDETDTETEAETDEPAEELDIVIEADDEDEVEPVQPDKLPFECEKCDSSFANARGLAGHKRVHAGED